MIDNVWQFLTILACLYIVLASALAYHRAPSVGVYFAFVALPAVITSAFYTLTLFTDWQGGHDWASPVRFVSFLILAAGVRATYGLVKRG